MNPAQKPPDAARLTNNWTLVHGLQGFLSRTTVNPETVPELLALILLTEAWKSFRPPESPLVFNYVDFRRFIEAPRPEGCQTSHQVLRRMVAGTNVADEVDRLLGRSKWGGDSASTSDVLPFKDGRNPDRKRDAHDEDRWNDESGTDGRADFVQSCAETERRETDTAYEAHKRRFVAAGGRESQFDSLNLLAAARLKADRLLSILTMNRKACGRPATEHEVRGLLSDLAGRANTARFEGRLRAFRRQLWPLDVSH